MKLANFEFGGVSRAGVVANDAVVDLNRANAVIPADIMAVIANWPLLEADVKNAATGAPHHKLSEVKLLAPVPRPQKVLAIGLNYADHIAESGQKTPERQVWFSKLPSSINAPYDPILMPKVSPAVDYEAELVAVIGKRCKHVAKEDAASVVLGLMCGNDVTVRDWQFHTPQWILGKSFDTHAPIGPWIVTREEIGDPHTLGIRCFVNGVKEQDSNTGNLVFNLYDQIALLSQAMTLEPGDLIFTGTPGGVGIAKKPPQFLKAGDVVRVEIDRIGAIEGTMMAEE
ncbi:MAG: 5-carboxymethyl-2-hydroxymuconate isomerase [Alphaproteobacteria bacterium]|nr:5-carboxymethyl-2-hydroxymuconate isomerase [Alphaproteobacteria bacterium]